jgi:hypothetical protein
VAQGVALSSNPILQKKKKKQPQHLGAGCSVKGKQVLCMSEAQVQTQQPKKQKWPEVEHLPKFKSQYCQKKKKKQ